MLFCIMCSSLRNTVIRRRFTLTGSAHGHVYAHCLFVIRNIAFIPPRLVFDFFMLSCFYGLMLCRQSALSCVEQTHRDVASWPQQFRFQWYLPASHLRRFAHRCLPMSILCACSRLTMFYSGALGVISGCFRLVPQSEASCAVAW